MKHEVATRRAGTLLEHHDRRMSDAAPVPQVRSRYVAAVRQPLPVEHSLPWMLTLRDQVGAVVAVILIIVALTLLGQWSIRDAPHVQPAPVWSTVAQPLPISAPPFRVDPIRVALPPVAIDRVVSVKAITRSAPTVAKMPVLSDAANPFAATVVRYQPAPASATASEEPSASAYWIASIASSDLVLIASGEAGNILVTPYHKGDQLPDGRTIVAIDASRSRVVTSGAPIVAGM